MSVTRGQTHASHCTKISSKSWRAVCPLDWKFLFELSNTIRGPSVVIVMHHLNSFTNFVVIWLVTVQTYVMKTQILLFACFVKMRFMNWQKANINNCKEFSLEFYVSLNPILLALHWIQSIVPSSRIKSNFRLLLFFLCIATSMCVTIDGVSVWILNLLTHHSELKVITEPSLISLIYKSPQHTLSLQCLH